MPQQNDNQDDGVMEQLQALGYIDPGAGSSMTQIILAGFFRISQKIKLFFRKVFGLGSKDFSDGDK